MRKVRNKTKNRELISILVFLIPLFLLLGCDKNIELEETPTKIVISGGVAKNLDNNSAMAAVSLSSGGVNYKTAIVQINNDTLVYDSATGLYLFDYDSTSALNAGFYYLKISQSSHSDSIMFAVPTDFTLDSLPLPDGRVNPAGTDVQLDWQISTNADGYILAVTQKDSVYVGGGYSIFVTSGATSANILPDAFRLSGELDTGWYYVYVYSYDAVPAIDTILPTTIPTGLGDNIAYLYLAGRFGSVVVSLRDSIHVMLQ